MSFSDCSFTEVRENRFGIWERTGHYWDVPLSRVRAMLKLGIIKEIHE